MAETRRCYRCEGAMEEGFIVDTIIGAETRQAAWGKGKPTKVLLTGVKPSSGLDPYPVVTFRCIQCGHLESYTEPFT